MDYETETLQFIKNNFQAGQYTIDRFKPGELIYVYIRSLDERNRQVQLEIHNNKVGISNVEIEQTEADFSLPDIVYTNMDDVKKIILEIKNTKRWPTVR